MYGKETGRQKRSVCPYYLLVTTILHDEQEL